MHDMLRALPQDGHGDVPAGVLQTEVGIEEPELMSGEEEAPPEEEESMHTANKGLEGPRWSERSSRSTLRFRKGLSYPYPVIPKHESCRS